MPILALKLYRLLESLESSQNPRTLDLFATILPHDQHHSTYETIPKRKFGNEIHMNLLL